ncbi:hypothetical protein EYF80_012000 [Liparis tanakae]|uniref:Uncharacterized protein n=1 Tax=Liparis tanakae TaxID=230148 RepID=A0A4Z2IKA0_9TELE|nr:hypothetical protein EYF80_012000 [Liparis tanakae]
MALCCLAACYIYVVVVLVVVVLMKEWMERMERMEKKVEGRGAGAEATDSPPICLSGALHLTTTTEK